MLGFPGFKGQPLESGWHIYGPENGYNFSYTRLLRVKSKLKTFILCNSI